MVAVILAGGLGTRLKSVRPDVPKPLVEVAGKPFLHWVTAWAAAQGETRFVYSAGHLGDQIVAWAAAENRADPKLQRQVVLETAPLGTGGAVVNCLEAITEDRVLVLNGDSLVLCSLAVAHERLDDDATLDGVMVGVEQPPGAAGRFGALDVGDTGVLRGFTEKCGVSRLINGGIYLLRTPLLRDVPLRRPLSMETDCFPHWLAAGRRISVKATTAPFLDMGTPDSLARADDFILANRARLGAARRRARS